MAITFWFWLILGLALIAVEVVMPGTWLLWPGIAALATGIVAYMGAGLPWQLDAIIFTVLTAITVLVGRKVYGRLRSASSDEPMLNRRAQGFVGTTHTLATPILDGQGRLKLGDATWKIVGPDLPTGTRIRIVGVDGIALVVERLDE